LIRLTEAMKVDASELLPRRRLLHLPVYLRTKYGHLPAGARKELADIVARLEARARLGHAPLDQTNK
jgi:hypothetical protein